MLCCFSPSPTKDGVKAPATAMAVASARIAAVSATTKAAAPERAAEVVKTVAFPEKVEEVVEADAIPEKAAEVVETVAFPEKVEKVEETAAFLEIAAEVVERGLVHEKAKEVVQAVAFPEKAEEVVETSAFPAMPAEVLESGADTDAFEKPAARVEMEEESTSAPAVQQAFVAVIPDVIDPSPVGSADGRDAAEDPVTAKTRIAKAEEVAQKMTAFAAEGDHGEGEPATTETAEQRSTPSVEASLAVPEVHDDLKDNTGDESMFEDMWHTTVSVMIPIVTCGIVKP